MGENQVRSLQPLVKYRTKAPPTAFPLWAQGLDKPPVAWASPLQPDPTPVQGWDSQGKGWTSSSGPLSSALSRSASTGRKPCGRRAPGRPRGGRRCPRLARLLAELGALVRR